MDAGADKTELMAAAASPETMMEELEQLEDGTMTITVEHVDLI